MLATVDPNMSPLGTPGAKRGREELNNDNSETLMVEESPSPAPDGEQLRLLRDRMKRQRLCETTETAFLHEVKHCSHLIVKILVIG